MAVTATLSAAVNLVSPRLALWGTVTVAVTATLSAAVNLVSPCLAFWGTVTVAVTATLLLAWYHPALPSGVQSLWLEMQHFDSFATDTATTAAITVAAGAAGATTTTSK